MSVSSRRCRAAASAARVTAASSTKNATAPPVPQRGLSTGYEFSIRRGHLWLDRLYSVSHVDGSGAAARIHRIALRGAGEPATGAESWLHPFNPSN
jgi:hypothetical protein